MGSVACDGLVLTPLKNIFQEKGNVLHAMKSSDAGYQGFGEAYFSCVHFGEVKGWKKHLRMTLNLVVPVGQIQFVIYDDREISATRHQFFEVSLSLQNYQRLTVAPGLWLAFRGESPSLNLLLNLASIPHDPSESETASLEKIPYQWGKL